MPTSPPTHFVRLLLALALIASPVFAASDDEGFQPLFPQEGAPEGWIIGLWSDVSQPGPEGAEWIVRDGVLVGDGSRGSWLISEQEYGDFELAFDFKLGPLGNSGCALRTPAAGDPAFDGLELQMADFRYNPEAKDSELTGGLYRALAPAEQVYRPTEWNSYHIRLVGRRVTVVLNDQEIIDANLADYRDKVSRHDGSDAPPLAKRPLRGRIGFQNLSRGEEPVLIRGARIKVLGAENSGVSER